MEPEKESRIKNGIELTEAMQRRAKKRRREQENGKRELEELEGKTRLIACERRLHYSTLRKEGEGKNFVSR